MRVIPLWFATLLIPAALAAQASWDAVARALGQPAPAAGPTYRAAFPRTDLRVRVGAVTIEPALALTSWAGFAGTPDSSDVMGDLVLTERELPIVVSGLLDSGIEVTAVHHHLVGETPRVFYVHFHGRGPAAELASRLRTVLARTGTPVGTAAARGPVAPAGPGLDTAAVFAALGVHGHLAGRVIQVSVPTSGSHATMDGRPIPAALGMNTGINLQPAGPRGRAVTTGDFVVTADKLQGLLRALSAAGIRPTAVHNHLTGEEPRAFFVHFWGEGEATTLAGGLKQALQAAQ